MTRNDVVQVVLPPDLGSWVRQRAGEVGVSASAWVRELIVAERSHLFVDAWWWSKEKIAARDSVRAHLAGPYQRIFVLERVTSDADNEAVEFRVLDPEHGRRIFADALVSRYSSILEDLFEGAFILRGDTRLWRVKNSFADAADRNTWRVVLKPESTRN